MARLCSMPRLWRPPVPKGLVSLLPLQDLLGLLFLAFGLPPPMMLLPRTSHDLPPPDLRRQDVVGDGRGGDGNSNSNNSSGNSSSRKYRPTAYLDGLRGLAAILVCICHYTENNHPELTPWYGVQRQQQLSQQQQLEQGAADVGPVVPTPSAIQLPFVRILFSGRPMVHIFFVISGFALSHRALAEARMRNWTRVHAVLSSSAFRRPLRLCTLAVAALVHFGWLYDGPGPPQLPTLGAQVAHWAAAAYYHVVWPWAWDTHLWPPYDVHLWTIPVELCHSMLLFVVLAALSRVRAPVRVAGAGAFMLYCLHCGRWAAFEFVGGMVLAELHLASAERRTAPPVLNWVGANPGADFTEKAGAAPEQVEHSVGRLELAIHVALLVAALYIAGWPNVGSLETPGIRFLATHAPASFPVSDPEGPQKFWFALCAVAVVRACGRVPALRRALEARWATASGRVSFAVYVVHGPVLDLCQGAVLGGVPGEGKGDMMTGTGTGTGGGGGGLQVGGLRGLFGTDTVTGRTACWAGGVALLAPLVWAVAHLFCVYVDEPIVRLARRVERWCLVVDDERQQQQHDQQEQQSTLGSVPLLACAVGGQGEDRRWSY
ncbi:acyltransferase 3 [Xylariaceae sp. FL0804]|nr:acyltransferase 3 [Xylariaceae sp. FL0804]